MADWQDTYGRLEIWEVDDRGLKWLQYELEYNWNDTERSCIFYDDDNSTECDPLPLPGTNRISVHR